MALASQNEEASPRNGDEFRLEVPALQGLSPLLDRFLEGPAKWQATRRCKQEISCTTGWIDHHNRFVAWEPRLLQNNRWARAKPVKKAPAPRRTMMGIWRRSVLPGSPLRAGSHIEDHSFRLMPWLPRKARRCSLRL